ncbi:MAG: phenylalanine--tRNA ligase subunit beta [Chitinophagaceae bacterium]
MTISYNWLSEYLPVKVEPERLSKILTSIGLEVESMKKYESIRGGLKDLVIGEVIESENHPNADKLKLTRVDIGNKEVLQIVCGAPNVAVGQKVVVAPVGATIYPANGQPMTMKIATIRNVESYGMICAEDELGLGNSHEGILILPSTLKTGSPASSYFEPYDDIIYEIGLTPNRMDAMSHLGVARDVCAYLVHHDKKMIKTKTPFTNTFKADNNSLPIIVSIENKLACQRYAGVSIKGVTIAPSPKWLQDKLKSIGLRPINNIVDITNYILHETGQPLHAFNADVIKGRKIIVKNLEEGTPFITLDEKERTLSAQDLMICNEDEPMCIAGVFGGFSSGVKDSTTNIFLESAWFNPESIRKSSFRHNLRTDAASRFEKGVDISNTVNVLKRAAIMIKEIAGGKIASDIIDVYPDPKPRTEVVVRYHYLKKLSGKNYHQDAIRKILEALGFEMIKEGIDEMLVKVPYSKTDISIPADIVEEILRIDGYDNIEIPSSITISPSVDDNSRAAYKEKISNYLTGAGFHEIMTNSITNSRYFDEEILQSAVKMVNSLSTELNIMRPSMLETGLVSLAYNLNRRHSNLLFFEFGKTYRTNGIGKYEEHDHLSLYATGHVQEVSWRNELAKADFYFMKGITAGILQLMGVAEPDLEPADAGFLENGLRASVNGKLLLQVGTVSTKVLERFDIKQPVIFADFSWDVLAYSDPAKNLSYTELPRQLPVRRDLAIVVPKNLAYSDVEKTVNKIKLLKLQTMQLFDIFESDKLGDGKKSLAMSFTFLDKEKTLNDKEIDDMMNSIMTSFEKELQAEIRK